MAQSPTVDLPKRLPLLAEPQNRDGTTDKDAKLVNCYVETQKTVQGNEYWILKRPGLSLLSQPPGASAAGSGVYNWKGDVYSIFADRVYRNGTVLAGTVDSTGGVYQFSSNLGATPHLQFGNGVEAYNYDVSGGIVLINDADFPTTFVKGWAYLDATTYVMKSNAHIQGSALNDATTWDPLNDIVAQIEPDDGKALTKQLVYVIALKQWSTEVFYDAGNATGSPLGQVQGAKVSFGCVTADTLQDINGALFWVCTSKDAGTQVGVLESLKFDVISTKPVERLLQTADWTTAFSWQLSMDGHRFYVITSKNSNFTFAFDLDERLWYQWKDSSGNYMPIVASTYDSSRRAVLQHETNGRLYYASAAYTSDAGDIITCDLITPNFDAGVQGRGKYMARMYFVADQTAGSELWVRKNDADYDLLKWSTPRRVDLSKRLPYLDACGSFNRRAHWMQHKSDTRMRLKAVELQMDLCLLPAQGG